MLFQPYIWQILWREKGMKGGNGKLEMTTVINPCDDKWGTIKYAAENH
jgi:hypothetical protein